jgi:hypothetical protein
MARQRGRQDSKNLWGVLGLTHTQSGEVFQDISNAQPRETSYIQHRHFGAAFAFYWAAILGNRLKIVENARRSSASIVQLSLAGTVARLFFRHNRPTAFYQYWRLRWARSRRDGRILKPTSFISPSIEDSQNGQDYHENKAENRAKYDFVQRCAASDRTSKSL